MTIASLTITASLHWGAGPHSCDLAPRLALRLVTYLLDFVSERFVFPHFALQEPHRDSGFLFNSTGSQQIHVRSFVPAALEVRCLDQALIDQAPQAEVDFPKAEPEFLGNLALAQLRVWLQQF